MKLMFVRCGSSHFSGDAHAAFPPNSNDSFLSVPLLCFMRSRPTGVDPVKEILETLTLQHSQLPTVHRDIRGQDLSLTFHRAQDPQHFLSPLSMVTTLTTPGGIPTRSQRTHMARADKGVSAGALMTTVQPAARAGAILRVIMALGKFLYNEAMSLWILK